MYRFKSFQVEDVITHASTKIDFKPGITVIRGENASGKSSLFQSLTKLATNDLPYAQKKNEKEFGGSARLVFEKNGIEYDIKANFAKNKYSIIKDGKLIDYRKAKDSQEAVANILPWSLDAWQNFVYVSSDTFPILLRGKASQRRAVFEDFFDIDTSRQKKLVTLRLKKLNEQRLKLDALSPVNFYGKINIQQERQNYRKYEKSIERLQADLERLNSELVGAEPSAQLWRQLCDKYSILKDIDEAGLVHLIKDVKEAESNLKMYIKLEKLEEAIDILENIKKTTKNINVKSILSEEKTNQLEAIVSNEVGIKKIPKIELFTEYDKDEIEKIQRLLLALEDGDSTHCPVCKQILKNKIGLINNYTSTLNKLQDKKKTSEKFIRYMKHFEQEHGFKLPSVEEIEPAKKALENHYKTVKFKNDLDRVPRLEKFIIEKKKELGSWEPELEKVSYETFSAIGKDAGMLLENRLEYIRQKNSGTVRDEQEIRDDIHYTKTQIKYQQEELLISSNIINHWKKWYKKSIKYKIANLDRKPLELLLDIYNKKLKQAATGHVLSHWLNEMNKAAKLTYGEGYEFGATIDANGISITCRRKKDKIFLVSDIRRFSGYESKMFPIASLMAMAHILPDELRTNILILDEIESNMSGASRRRLVKMLPQLQKLYECIIIITPSNIEEFPIQLEDLPVREYRVEMRGGVSVLKEVG